MTIILFIKVSAKAKKGLIKKSIRIGINYQIYEINFKIIFLNK